MTDETNYTPSASVADQINAMVSAASERADRNPSNTPVGSTQAHVFVHADGTVDVSEIVTSSRIADDGRDLIRETENMHRQVDEIQAKLDLVIYDPRTGAPSPRYTGQEREALERTNIQLRNAQYFQARRYADIHAQREADTASRNADIEERATMLRLTGGNPVKQARLEALLGDDELKTGAQAILARRFERAQGR